MSDEVIACCSNFAAQYEQNAHPAFRDLERSVLGCDYGGTSWTTRRQAEGIIDLLALGEGVGMLELGAGAGWPSVFLAGRSGCELTLLDLPVGALHRARGRALNEGIENMLGAVSASGAQLPFETESFDAIGHSDVLCCLPEKLEMLQECRRVARGGARMLFYVIYVADLLSDRDRAEGVEAGPPFVDTDDDYPTLLSKSGWKLLQRKRVNNDYLLSLRSLVAGFSLDADTFSEVMGVEEFEQTLKRRRHQVSAVERGLLMREMFLAEAE